MSGDQKLTDKELRIEILELNTQGYIEFDPGDSDTFRITEKGMNRAQDIFNTMPLHDRLLLLLFAPEAFPGIFEDVKERGDSDA